MPENEKSPSSTESEIPDSHYAAMGKVDDAWCGLELCIDYLIWELLGVDQIVGACVTSQFISVHPRLKTLRAVCPPLFPFRHRFGIFPIDHP